MVAILGLLFFSACSPTRDAREVDRLNTISYAFHYRDLDSSETYAKRAYELSKDYDDGRAEALNNLAFVSIIRMDYDKAAMLLDEAERATDNSVELLVTAVQQMRLCQRMSHNREFYDRREQADMWLGRVKEDRSVLTTRQRARMTYAESEYDIVTSTYYYYVGLQQQSREALARIDGEEIQKDTAQYLNYLYNIGAGGIVVGNTQEEVRRQEFEALAECFFISRQREYPYFAANALEAMAEHLLDPTARDMLLEEYSPVVSFIAPDVTDVDILAGRMADTSLMLFKRYGDAYQTAGAHRTLATCFMSINDYESALLHLEEALSDTIINRAPNLVASIREQLSVAYSAIDNKVASDYNRNLYLDLQEQTRQDRSLEARADMLDRVSWQLNVMIASVVSAMALLLFLLFLFSRLDRRQRGKSNVEALLKPLSKWQEENALQTATMKQRREETAEKLEVSETKRREQGRRNMDNRAKVALANSVIPFIDRMLNETTKLSLRSEDDAVKAERYKYIAELTDQVANYNDVLTQWIQLRQGMLSLKIETFPLSPLFDIVAKGRTAFRMKGVELSVEPTAALVKADRVLTLFMINTLSDNARKFTDKGGRVTISAHEADDYVEISVADTGRGIAASELASVFVRNASGDHGFGLMNCRGIIEKYRKTSRLFNVCMMSAESEEGKGSRFFFRLPRGVAKKVMALVLSLCAMSPMTASGNEPMAELSRAANFADSAYFSNIAGTYDRTLQFADSCRAHLNRHYLRTHPGSRILMREQGNTAMVPPEVKWYHDSVATNYSVILDIRNESAVAALALHKWSLYEYNNKVYTLLFKEMSADNTLEEYCRTMQQSQLNKTIAVTICVFALMLILPAYYVLYYRHRLYYRFCVERIDAINTVLLGDMSPEDKLKSIEPCLKGDYPARLKAVVERIVEALREAVEMRKNQTIDLELAEDELKRSELEANNLYVCNAVLDNCLSALKHETMYYPSRIRLLACSEHPVVGDLLEMVAYYRDLCSLLGRQALWQLEGLKLRMGTMPASEIVAGAPASIIVVGNKEQLRYLFELLERQLHGTTVTVAASDTSTRYVVFTVTARTALSTVGNEGNIFVPSIENIPYLICRQIVREHSEATDSRGCGIEVCALREQTYIKITLPRKA